MLKRYSLWWLFGAQLLVGCAVMGMQAGRLLEKRTFGFTLVSAQLVAFGFLAGAAIVPDLEVEERRAMALVALFPATYAWWATLSYFP